MTIPPTYRYEWTAETLALVRHWVPIDGCEKAGIRLGINHTTVRKRVRKEGIAIGRERTLYTPMMKSVIATLTQKNMPVAQIAQTVGVTLTSIVSHLRERKRNRAAGAPVTRSTIPTFAKPVVEQKRAAVVRPCMGCSRGFPSQGAHNRYCDPCRKSMSCDSSYSLVGARLAG